MKWRLLDDASQRTYALVFDTGDEVVEGLQKFARETHATAAQFAALGALSDVTLGYFDWQKKDYVPIRIDEQVEVVNLTGNFAVGDDGNPALHAHIVVGRSDGHARGGHLLSAHVRPTLEAVVTESPAHLHRRHDPESGLALIRLGARN
jgi:predicted DNA-binding protein with PD1-like motif